MINILLQIEIVYEIEKYFVIFFEIIFQLKNRVNRTRVLIVNLINN